MMEISLSQLEMGKIARVKRFDGGLMFRKKVSSLGIRIGKSIRIISSQPFRGPIIIEIDKMRIAIGHGIANRIIVEV